MPNTQRVSMARATAPRASVAESKTLGEGSGKVRGAPSPARPNHVNFVSGSLTANHDGIEPPASDVVDTAAATTETAARSRWRLAHTRVVQASVVSNIFGKALSAATAEHTASEAEDDAPKAMDEDTSVVVGVRVRPFSEREKNTESTLCIKMDGITTQIVSEHEEPQRFAFDESFWSHDGFEEEASGYVRPVQGTSRYADQRHVFQCFGERVIANAWHGFHCCLFAYGQTGSGKSYSMIGTHANKGIVPMCCEKMFSRIDRVKSQTLRFEVTTSMVEIYNEMVQDLLVLPQDRPKGGLVIRESQFLGVYVEGTARRAVDSYPRIEAVMEEATANRTIGSTTMNITSSRAHTIITIEFKQIDESSPKAKRKLSVINLVDLAGCEKVSLTHATGERLKEGAYINKSLISLGLVMQALVRRSNGTAKANDVIPYRDSKLTRLLQTALGGSSKTIMICAVSPALSNYAESLSTLRYADRAKAIKVVAKVNMEKTPEQMMQQLREENERLLKLIREGSTKSHQLNRKLTDLEADEQLLTERAKDFSLQLAESAQKQDFMQRRRARLSFCGGFTPGRGSSTPVVEVQHMVNLNEDPQLSGQIIHKFEEGRTIIGGEDEDDGLAFASSSSDLDEVSVEVSQNDDGSSKSSDNVESGVKNAIESDHEVATNKDVTEERRVTIVGVGLSRNHAEVENQGGRCTLTCPGETSQRTFVNGKSFHTLRSIMTQHDAAGNPFGGIELRHGDRIIFCRNVFLFIDPLKGRADLLIKLGAASFAKAMEELEDLSWFQRLSVTSLSSRRRSSETSDGQCVLCRRCRSDDEAALAAAEARTAAAEALASAAQVELTQLRAVLQERDQEVERLRVAMVAGFCSSAGNADPRRVGDPVTDDLRAELNDLASLRAELGLLKALDDATKPEPSGSMVGTPVGAPNGEGLSYDPVSAAATVASALSAAVAYGSAAEQIAAMVEDKSSGTAKDIVMKLTEAYALLLTMEDHMRGVVLLRDA